MNEQIPVRGFPPDIKKKTVEAVKCYNSIYSHNDRIVILYERCVFVFKGSLRDIYTKEKERGRDPSLPEEKLPDFGVLCEEDDRDGSTTPGKTEG